MPNIQGFWVAGRDSNEDDEDVPFSAFCDRGGGTGTGPLPDEDGDGDGRARLDGRSNVLIAVDCNDCNAIEPLG